MGKASTEHQESLLVGISLVCCKEKRSVVCCVLLIWHSGITSAHIDAEAGSLSLHDLLGGKSVTGVVCIWLRAFTHE